MSYLKSFYFYFLAIKINSVKIVKKIFFSTGHYNKSLKTQIPKRFYFFPNSYLLSSITNYRNFSFNLTDVNVDKLWTKQTSEFEEKKLIASYGLILLTEKTMEK